MGDAAMEHNGETDTAQAVRRSLIRKVMRGAFTWLLGAVGVFLVSGILAYLARDLFLTWAGFLTLAVTFGGGYLLFLFVLAVTWEPLEWLDDTTP